MLAYVLAWRGIPVPSANLQTLRDMAGSVTDTELEEIAEWLNHSECSNDIQHWIQDGNTLPSAATAARALALRTGHQCLIPISMISSATKHDTTNQKLRLVLAYYARRNLSCIPLPTRLTAEQKHYAGLGALSPDAEPSRHVINAGPGTGKTTTAVELVRNAVSIARTRVLLLSYTNSAVITLRKRIGADPLLGGKYLMNPFATKNAHRTITEPVLLSTVDQLALAILAGPTRTRTYGARSQNFDQIIIDALQLVTNSRQSLDIFLENGQTPMFTHIIIDEGQMLCDNRAALVRAIAHGLSTVGINGRRSCHMTVFCDPKQTISPNTGQWLVDMYTRASEGATRVVDLDGMSWTLGALTTCFRFEYKEMLDHVMGLSKKRPALHVDLHPSVPLESRSPVVYARSLADIDEVANSIAQAYRETRSVAVLSPTIGRTNAVSRQVSGLVLELRRLKVPICLHGEDNFQANGVMITTFNTCAGMEFKHVYIMGAAGYPKNYPQVLPEVARSLVFIANSRAIRSICYVLDRPELCVDVDKSAVYPLFDTSLSEYALPTRYIPKIPDAWTAEVMFANSVGQGGALYMETNGVVFDRYRIKHVSIPGASVSLYDALAVYGVPPCLQDAAVSVQDAISINPGVAHLRGIASCGRIILDNAGRRFMNDNGRPYVLEHPPSNTSSHGAFYWFTNRRPDPQVPDGPERANALRNALSVFIDQFDASPVKFCRSMMRQPKNADSHAPSSCFALCPDMFFKSPGGDGFVCFGDNPYHTLFVGAALWISRGVRPIMIHVDPWKGTIDAFDGFHEIMGYQLNILRRIHIYNQTTIFRDNYLGVPMNKRAPPGTFTVDTEFVNGNDIYEVGILNLSDPYRSISTPISSIGVDNVRIAKMGLDLGAYRKIAISCDDLALRFINIALPNDDSSDASKPQPRLFYYSSTVDTKWMIDGVVETVDVASIVSSKIPVKGTFESDSRAATLDAVYGMYIGPIDKSGRHQAFIDAIYLAEIVSAMYSE